jgi:exosome complex component RRP4
MSSLLVPGQLITSESGFLRGHGSYLSDINPATNAPTLISAVAGEIERVNRLICVRPIRNRYIGEQGDLVVGRISAVDSKRWKVDIGGQREAMLQLSSVTLPGGEQRIRTYEDQLQMRTLFEEDDLICAEVQMVTDNILHLHTRSLKYGKLENGQYIQVPASLMKRLPQHYISLPGTIGIDIIFGLNGGIWIARTIPEQWKRDAGEQDSDTGLTPLAETLQTLRNRHRDTLYTREQRNMTARVANVVRLLATNEIIFTVEHIMHVVQMSISMDIPVKDMFQEDIAKSLLEGIL